MEKRIPLISLAVLCSVILISSDYTNVYALSQIDVTVANNQNYSDLVDRNSVTGDPCRLFTLTTIQRVNAINCDTHVVFVNNVTLGTTGTSCDNLGNDFACNLGSGTFSGMECNRFFCYVKFTNATQNTLVRYDWITTGFTIVGGFMNFGSGSTIEVDSIESFSSNTGLTSTVWVAHICSGADTDRVIRIVEGVAMNIVGNVDNKACTDTSGVGGNLGANNVNEMKFVTKGTTNYLGVSTNQAVNNFRLFRLDSNAFVCQFSGATSNSLSYHNTLTEFYLIQNAVSGDVVRIENDASCTNNGTITDVTLGTTGQSLRRGDVNEARGEIYITDSSSKLVTLNNTYFKQWEYTLIGDIIGGFAIETNATEFAGVSTINKVRFVIITEGAPPSDGEDEQLTEFCAIAGNEDLLACFEEPALVGASELIGDSFQDLFVQVGLIDGSNMNCATNGVGYFMTATALGIMIGIFWVASRGDLTNIPTFIWFLASLAIVSAITIMDCLDPVWFIIAVIAIIALAVAKTKSNIFGSFVGE